MQFADPACEHNRNRSLAAGTSDTAGSSRSRPNSSRTKPGHAGEPRDPSCFCGGTTAASGRVGPPLAADPRQHSASQPKRSAERLGCKSQKDPGLGKEASKRIKAVIALAYSPRKAQRS